MVVSFKNIQIKDLKKQGVYSIFVDNKKNGTILLSNNKLDIIIADKSYRQIVFRLFANYLFKNNYKKITYLDKEYTKKSFYILNNYKTILSDIDDTILSFHKAEVKSLSAALKHFNVEPKEEVLADYSKINLSYWEKVERNEITREQCLVLRFEEFLPKYNINCSASVFEDIYREHLNTSAYMVDGARKVFNTISKQFDLYAITNGVKNTQDLRMKKARITKLFKDIFISEAIGYNKPDIKFYNYVKSHINNYNKAKTIVIGDSLTSDIMLGNNAHVDTIYYNPKKNTNYRNISFTYEINYIEELLILSNNY